MLTKQTWLKGLQSGLNTTWLLAKVIFPVTFIITILKFTPVIGWLINIFTPLMQLIGLPGEAAIPLVLGNVLNLYAAIGAILTLELTVKNVFILAVMLGFSHNLIVETAIVKKIGVKGSLMVAIRLSLATLSAIIINKLWQGGNEIAQYTMTITTTQTPEAWSEIVFLGLKTATNGILQIAIIVIPLMVGIQILKDLKAIAYLSKKMKPITRLLGLSTEKTSIPLLAGLIFGLAYGAGLIIESTKEENLSKKDLYLLSIFLVSSHAVFEDTVIFIPLGIAVIPLLIIRVTTATITTIITAKLWPNHSIKISS